MIPTSIKSKEEIAISQINTLFIQIYPQNEPGAAVLVMKGDKILFDKGYGLADMGKKIEIDGNTFFNIASVSKQFSAVALMMLAEEGKLSLDDSVKKFFPNFKADFYNKITLRHLMSHTSGLPDNRPRNNQNFIMTATDKESYKYLESQDTLNFEPGTAYEYMNPTFQLMYTIIEQVSGMGFDQFMKDKIFSPSNMKKATYFEADKLIPSMAYGYIQEIDLKGVKSTDWTQFDYGREAFFATKADGGIYTSTREFVEWERAIRKNLFIGKEMTKEAHSPKIKIPETEIPHNHYGYGWFIENIPSFPTKVYHTGDNGGFYIYAARFPEQEILYLIFANRNDKNREELAHKIDDILRSLI